MSADCGDPTNPHDGIVYYDSTTIGSVANYSCNADCHEINYTATCERGVPTAIWLPEPQCQGKV